MKAKLDLNLVSDELDALHAAARRAYLARDLNAYRDFFTHDLRYIQPDGKSIGRVQLMRDVGKQLSQFKSVDSEVTRKSITENENGTVTQVAHQTGTYTVSAFFILTKTWKIDREAKYTFRKTEGEWKICQVEVLDENVE